MDVHSDKLVLMQDIPWTRFFLKQWLVLLLALTSIQLNGQIACSSSVQISMDEYCQAVLKPEVFLQGFYDDFEYFELTIEGVDGNIVYQPGNYAVTVTDTRTDNSCWGTAVVENKLPPKLNCKELIVPCFFDAKPGDNMLVNYRGVGVLGQLAPGHFEVDFHFQNTIPPFSYIEDVEVELYQTHEDISHLSAFLKSPGGTKIQLFQSSETTEKDCLKEEMFVHFSDQYNNDNQLIQQCDPGNALIGQYKPNQQFHAIKGEPAWGNWSLHIEDAFGKPIHQWFKHAVIHVATSAAYSGLPFDRSDMQFKQIADQRIEVWGGDLCGPVTLSYTDEFTDGCSSSGNQYGTMNRNWQVDDGVGNVNWCQQAIHFETSIVENIIMPYDYDDVSYPSFHCLYDWGDQIDASGQPSPKVTGYPKDRHLYKERNCGNIEVSYKDAILPICEGSYKIIRTWTLINWCKDAPLNIHRHNQIIEIKDRKGPKISCPLNTNLIVQVTSPHDCGKNILVPSPQITQGCGSYDWTIKYAKATSGSCEEPASDKYTSDGVQQLDSDIYINSLESGCVWIKYFVSDGCGNTTEYACQMQLRDNSPPVAVCDETTVIALSNDGTASIPASTFDDFSTDNCTSIFFKGRKLENACDTINEPSEFIEFCCAEAGQTIAVEIFVFDQNGNKSSCTVQARVQDKLDAYLKCPDDTRVACYIPIHDLTDEIYGAPKANDNCGTVGSLEISYTDSLDQCGVGIVYKTWTIVSNDDFLDEKVCTQRFTFEFEPATEGHQIYFPVDTVLNGCARAVGLDETGEPLIIQNGCGLLAINHEDNVFEIAEDACEKILREWTIIDWCQYKPELGIYDGFWQQTQVIKFNNTTDPQITSSCEPIEVCTSASNCMGSIDLHMAAIDDCTNARSLTWEYSLDLYSDRRTDMRATSLVSDGDSITVSISDIPLDVAHEITWRVHDGCLNYGECTQQLVVKDCRAPVPFCIGGVVITLMDRNGLAQVWARDFDLKSEDNCSDSEELQFSFSNDVSDINRTFDCSDVPNGRFAQVELEVFVTDPAGNQESCHVVIELQDNLSACANEGDEITMDVEGAIQTETDAPIDGVEVTIDTNLPGFPKTTVSDEKGKFTFPTLPSNENYDITSFKNDDYLNGVSTLDIVAIQQHILGIKEFTSPYTLFAADIDNNLRVNASDLVDLKRVVLGYKDTFSNGQLSWRFVNTDIPILDERNPFPFTESIQISEFQNLQREYAFMGVKIGDVNHSVKMSNSNALTEVRDIKEVEFLVSDELVEENQLVDIAFRISKASQLLGFQYGFKFDPLAFNILSIDGGEKLEINESDRRVMANEIRLSWTDREYQRLESGDVVFIVKVRMQKSGYIKDFLSFTSDFDAEWYEQTTSLAVINSKIEPKDTDKSGFVLHQNQPNPFEQSTQINIELYNRSTIQLKLVDVSGAVVYQTSESYPAGKQTIHLSKDIIGTSGLFYYTVSVNGKSQTKKLVVL